MGGRFIVLTLVVVGVPMWAQTQAPTRSTALVVVGQTGTAPVVQVNGRSYVEVESLVRLLHGTIGFQGTRIVLDPTGQSGAVAPPAPPAAAASGGASGGSPGLSRDFVTASVGALSAMREWQTQLAYAVQHNQPVQEELLGPSRRRTEAQVAITVAAARNDQDRSAGVLLQNEFANLRSLSGNYIALHDASTNIRNDALTNDPLAVKTQNCLAALAGLGSGGQFQDVPTCH